MKEGKGNTTRWEDIRKALEENWFGIFGRPAMLRVDPAGPWMSEEADQYCSERDIELAPIPGEAHWQISLIEGAINNLKGMLTKLAEEFVDAEITELVARSTWVCNSEEMYKGYSPLQQVLGRAPDQNGRMFEEPGQRPISQDLRQDGGFREDVQMRCRASQAFAEEQAKRRLQRAERMGARRSQTFLPGDLVYYWRNQVPLKERTAQNVGRFIGPARVLAMETRRAEGGELRSGSVVWLHRAGRLIRTAPEQLRKASPHELEMEELAQPIDIPWTMTALLPDRCRNYVDLSGDLPNEEQWQAAQEEPPRDEAVPQEVKRRRITGKGGDSGKSKKRESQEEHAKREVRHCSEGGASSSRGERNEEEVLDAFYAEEEHCQVVEIQIEVPTSKRGLAKFTNNAEAYVCSQLKKKMVEVSEKRLKPEELKKFRGAKDKEVRNYIAAECFVLANKEKPEEKMILGMRWLLTWKFDEQSEGGKKAKARAIILGYQDPHYSQRPTAAPTPTKAGRQLFFQLCAWKKFKLAKGDISGAFLQGEDLQEEIWCRPLDEIAIAMGVSPGTPMLMKKAAYGLVQAPLHWHNSVNKYLKSQGYIQLQTEPCCWIWVDQEGEVRSAIHAHVDDFLFAGQKECPVHDTLMNNVRKAFTWGTWEFGQFPMWHRGSTTRRLHHRAPAKPLHWRVGRNQVEPRSKQANRKQNHRRREITASRSAGFPVMDCGPNMFPVLGRCQLPDHKNP